jgi:glycosylphosphatidylinositol transamidase (GPIT) subunit GPI8
MYAQFHSPNIFAMSSSIIGESSYSYTVDENIGVSIVDRYAFQLFEFLTSVGNEHSTLQELIDYFDPQFLGSTPHHRADLFSRPAQEVRVHDFFSAAKASGLAVGQGKNPWKQEPTRAAKGKIAQSQHESESARLFEPCGFKISWKDPRASQWSVLSVLLSMSLVLFSRLLLKRSEKGSHNQ